MGHNEGAFQGHAVTSLRRLSCLSLIVALVAAVCGSGHAAVPSAGTIGPSSGQISWRFAAVDSFETQSDDFALTVKLPSPDAEFYADHSAVLTVDLAWSSPIANDLDLYTVSPRGRPSGYGVPDALTTGPQRKRITIHNPESGRWTIEAASLGPSTETDFTPNIPTTSEGTATLMIVDTARETPASPPEDPGLLTVTSRTVDIPLVAGGSLSADLYLPPRTNLHPLIEFVHGSPCALRKDHFVRWGQLLASHGFVVVVPDRRVVGRVPGLGCKVSDPAEDPEDLLQVLRWAVAQNFRPGSPLFHEVDGRHLGIAGHSYGADITLAAVLLSTIEGPHLSAAVLSGGTTGTPVGLSVESRPIVRCDAAPTANRLRAITVPMGVFDASLDLSPWPDPRSPDDCLFDRFNAPKLGMMIDYANHCEFEDPTEGWSSCIGGPLPTLLPNPDHQRLYHRYVTAWFELFLQCDPHAIPYANGPVSRADQTAASVLLLKGSSTFQSLPSGCTGQ